MRSTLQLLLDGEHAALGKLHPLYCSARSPSGLWFGGGVQGNTTLLFTRNGRTFESKPPPNGHNWASLVCMSDAHLVTGSHWGIEQTTNGGKTWKRTDESEIYKLSRAPDGTLWASGNGTVLRSPDGAKWTRVHAHAGVCFGAMHWQRDTMLLGGQGAIWRAGKKLTLLLDTKGRYVQAIAERPDGMLMAVGADGFLARSSDGVTWKVLDGGTNGWMGIAWSGDRFVLAGEGSLATTEDGSRLAYTKLGQGLVGGAVLADEGGVFVCAGRAPGSKPNAPYWGEGALFWWGSPRTVSTATLRQGVPATPSLAPVVRSLKRPRNNGMVGPEHVQWEALASRLKLRKHVPVGPSIERARRYDDVIADRSLKWSAKPCERRAVVVDGDLWCKGMLELFAMQDEDAALLIYVRGNVSVRDLAVRDDAVLLVEGTLEAERLVMCGGGNLGTIVVGKTLRAGLVLEWTDGAIRAQAAHEVPAWAWEKQNVRLPKALWIKTPAHVLAPAYLDEDGLPDADALLAAARRGVVVFR